MRLSASYRRLIYAVIAVLAATGVIWVAADRLKDSETGEFWQSAAANTLMIHGAAAMAMLILLGALIPLHIRRSWRIGKNRATGMAMVAGNGLLVITAFGLYYPGSPFLRSWTSDLHLVLGSCLPILLILHIAVGRCERADSEPLLDRTPVGESQRLPRLRSKLSKFLHI